MNNWWDHFNDFILAGVTALITSVVWLIRMVLTNQKEIELLKQEIMTRRSVQEDQDNDIKDQLQEIRQDIKHLLERQ